MSLKMQEDFISHITRIISENIADEHFGVSELAAAVSMSRSNLLRKIRKNTGLSASQFIRQVRLEIAMEMLKNEPFTVSEVSYRVGFGSASYFIKCFREHYGYPPGEARKQPTGLDAGADEVRPERLSSKKILAAFLAFIILPLLVYAVWPITATDTDSPEKSIAVLPFKNESNDTANVYFINGLMESTLNNLQKIEDLRVLSRTSVEKYRHAALSIPEIAEELNVSYFVEGSGQKVGDQVLLNVQLIDGSTDTHIWAEQYSRQISDVFALQNEIATNIADAIEAIVTPEELEQISKRPTEILVAYDYYLKSREPIFSGTTAGLLNAIELLELAIGEDPEFALAYADIAISYYYMDLYQTDKRYTDEINTYADKALLYDPRSDVSLLAKAFYYMHVEEYRLALPHLNKALEYNPNSSAVIQTLSDYYARIRPDTSKYLEYALKGLKINSSESDSISRSYLYLHLSNAFVQSGFVDEAIGYINQSLAYNPENFYSPYVQAYILFARDRDIEQTRTLLLNELEKDSTRLDILQEVAKTYYYDEDYDRAYYYYSKFTSSREEQGLNIYPQEDIKIGVTFEKVGLTEEAAGYIESYAEFCETDQSIYKSASSAVLYAYEGKYDLAVEQLDIFAEQDNIQYWILLFMDKDPVMKPLYDHPGFKDVMNRIEKRFWDNHAKLRSSLESEGLI